MSSAEPGKQYHALEERRERGKRVIETIRRAYFSAITFARDLALETKNYLIRRLNALIEERALWELPFHDIEEIMFLTFAKILENEGIEFELESITKKLR